MQLVFRYDDFSAGEIIPYAVDDAVLSLFSQKRMPLVIGVTPFMVKNQHSLSSQIGFSIAEDSQRRCLLGKAIQDGCQIALHGCTHARTAMRDYTEFAGEPALIQQQKLAEGLRCLERILPGVPLDVFIPPWNTYDQTTIECLNSHKFKAVTGREPWCKDHGELKFVPSPIETHDFVDYIKHYSLADLDWALGSALLVVTMHGYDFSDRSRPGFTELCELATILDEVKQSGLIVSILPFGGNVPFPSKWRLICLRSKLEMLSQRNYNKVFSAVKALALRLAKRKTWNSRIAVQVLALGVWGLMHGLRMLKRMNR